MLRPLYHQETAPGTHWTGGWVGLRAGMDDVKKTLLTIQGLELQPLDRPERSQSHYRLRYAGKVQSVIGLHTCTSDVPSRVIVPSPSVLP
jgi:hypothetical protein